MLLKLLAGALAALLLSALMPMSTLTAQTSGVTDPALPDCLEGKAAGAWDLPSAREGGRMRGRLFDVNGVRFAIDGRLSPMTTLGDRRGGRLDGLLYLVTKDVRALTPIAAVHGTYLVGLEGKGQFEAVIVTIERDATVRPTVLGKIAGVFADPQLPDRNPVGSWVGRWALCR